MVVSVVADWVDDDTEHLRFRIITDSNRRGNKRFRLKCKEGSNQASASFVTSHVCAMPPLTCRSAVGWLVPNRTRCKSGNTKRRHKLQNGYIHQHAAAASQTQPSLRTFGEHVSIDVIRPLDADLQLRKSVRKGECYAVQCSPLCVPTLLFNFPSSLLPTCRSIKALHQKWSKEGDRRLLAGVKEVL